MARFALSGRKTAAIALGVVGVAGLSFASAATLGGLSVGSLGADTSIVAACDTNGIGVGFSNGYVAADKSYGVQTVNLTGVADACAAKNVKVTLADASGVSLGEVSLTNVTLAGTTVDAKTLAVAFPGAINAASVANVAVVINS